jgi:hypothetical protein
MSWDPRRHPEVALAVPAPHLPLNTVSALCFREPFSAFLWPILSSPHSFVSSIHTDVPFVQVPASTRTALHSAVRGRKYGLLFGSTGCRGVVAPIWDVPGLMLVQAIYYYLMFCLDRRSFKTLNFKTTIPFHIALNSPFTLILHFCAKQQ